MTSIGGGYKVYGRDAQPTPEQLTVDGFPYSVLMGDWQIVGSSLPLWKNRSDVLCRYTPHDIPSFKTQAAFHSENDIANSTANGQNGNQVDSVKGKVARAASKNVAFSDEIWWEQLAKNGSGKHLAGKGASREKQSIVRGRNKVDPKGTNAASFLWRGYKFLKPFTSHWQILAHSNNFFPGNQNLNSNENDNDNENDNTKSAEKEPIWLITYFTATIFTQAGIDLYVRGTLPDGAYEEIVEALKRFKGKGNDDAKAKELQSLAAKMFKIPVGNI